jgi:hypothetical protein
MSSVPWIRQLRRVLCRRVLPSMARSSRSHIAPAKRHPIVETDRTQIARSWAAKAFELGPKPTSSAIRSGHPPCRGTSRRASGHRPASLDGFSQMTDRSRFFECVTRIHILRRSLFALWSLAGLSFPGTPRGPSCSRCMSSSEDSGSRPLIGFSGTDLLLSAPAAAPYSLHRRNNARLGGFAAATWKMHSR